MTHPYLQAKYLIDDWAIAFVAENSIDVIAGVNPSTQNCAVFSPAFSALSFRETRQLLDKWIDRKDHEVLPDLSERERQWLAAGHQFGPGSDYPPYQFKTPQISGILLI